MLVFTLQHNYLLLISATLPQQKIASSSLTRRDAPMETTLSDTVRSPELCLQHVISEGTRSCSYDRRN